MRVIVTGGRDYADREMVRLALDYVLERVAPLAVIQGGASGADELARRWSWGLEDVSLITVPANWNKHGKAAGPIRNRTMLEQCDPDMVIAFPGGRGTANMIRIARAKRIPVVVIGDRASPPRIKARLQDAIDRVKGAGGKPCAD